MKQKRTIVAVLLLAALLLAACGQQGSPAATRDEGTISAASQPLAARGGGQPDIFAAAGTIEPTHVETDLFRAKFEGSEVAGTGEVVDGKYRFTATETDGEAWHVKLESNYPTVSGRDYRVTYRFTSDVAGKIKFGDFQEFDIQKGENTVTGIMIASGGTSYLDLQLGMLPPFTIEFSEIEVEEYADVVDLEDALETPVNFEKESLVYERHDQGYAALFTRQPDKISLNYVAASWEPGVWKSRLYIHTGLVPQAGVRYRITADVSCDQDLPFEVLFNNDEEEKGYGALYGQNVKAGETTTIEAVIIGGGDGDELVLQLSLGNVQEESTVEVGALHIEKIVDHYKSMLPANFALDKVIATGKMITTLIPVGYKAVPTNVSFDGTDTVYEGHDGDYEVSLEEGSDSATLKITKAPEEGRGVWKAKLFAATGVTLEAGSTYAISFDVSATADQAEYEACFDGDSENAYGALYSRSLTAGGTDHVEYSITPDASHGPLTLRLQLGKTDTTAGNNVTLSNIHISKLTAGEASPVELPDFKYPQGTEGSTDNGSFFLEANSGAEAALTGDGSSATATVTKPGDDWHVKLYAQPGLELQAGETYTISMNVSGAAGCTACYKNVNAGAEEGFGTEPIVDGTITHVVTPAESGTLEILLKIGNVPEGTAVKVSDVNIKESKPKATSILPSAIAFPDSFFLETNSGAEASLSGEGGSATATVTVPGADWNVKFYVKPHTKLEVGKTYQVSLHVSGAAGCPVCFKNLATSAEEGFGVAWLGADDQTVTQTIKPETEGELELLLKIGKVPADTAVTVSGVSVSELTDEFVDTELSGFSYPVTVPDTVSPGSFFLEANSGAAAVLGGNGSSATATVTVPGADWNVKLYAKPNVSLEAGKRYLITMNVTGADGCTACYKNVTSSAEDGFGTEIISSGTVSHAAAPDETGALEILLKIGKVPAGTTVTVSSIQISEYKDGNVDVTPGGFAYPVTTEGSFDAGSFDLEANSGAEAALSGDGSSATATVTKPGADWHVKFYAKPGIELQAGKSYKITMDVTGGDGCTVSYKNTATGAEDGFGTETLASGTVSHTVAVTESGPLEILLKIGNAPADTAVTVKNVKVEEIAFAPGEDIIPSFSYDSTGSVSYAADGGYIVSLDKASDSADFHILQAPAEGRNPWNVKLHVRTGFTPEANKGYRVSFDLASAKPQGTMEVFYDGSSEAAYGQLTGQSLSAGKKTVSYTIMPGSSKGELVLQIRLGKTDGTDGNDYTVSNVKIEEVSFQTKQTPEEKAVTVLWTHETYQSTLTTTPDKATVKVGKIPAEGREPWKTKLFVNTGAKLQEGQKYRVSMIVKSIIPTPFEVCFNNGEEEKGLGAIFGLISKPSGQYVEYVTYAKQDTDLVIQLSLGNCAPPNSVILDSVRVEKAGEIQIVSDTIYSFK